MTQPRVDACEECKVRPRSAFSRWCQRCRTLFGIDLDEMGEDDNQ